MNLLTQVPEAFAKLQDQQNDPALHVVREKAFEAYTTLGVPTSRNEEWKYTRLSGIVNKPYHFGVLPTAVEVSREALAAINPLAGHAKAGAELVFYNGAFSETLSNTNQEGLEVLSLEAAAAQYPALVEQHLAHSSAYIKDGMQALNTAFIQNGLFLRVKKNAVIDQPVYLQHYTDTTANSVFAQPRILIIVEENAQVQFVEAYSHKGSEESFTNEVIEIAVYKDARVEYYKIQDAPEHCHHVGTTHLQQAGKCFTHCVTITLNGGTIRNNLNMILEAPHNESHLYGLYMVKGNTHIDNHTIVDNALPNCYSNELYKGILDGNATGVFNGKIFVRKDAQKTNAFQSNKNILMGDSASINAKPQLEIFADDVKCSHGCTVGCLDEEALFYLRARGIGEDKARALLLHAFASDIINEVKPEGLRNYLEQLIVERLDISES
jgi:Fe-S cluster assembly protein SufD